MDRHSQSRWWVQATMLAILTGNPATADEVRLVPVENYTTAFAGDEIAIGMRIIGNAPPNGSLRWSHSANQRTMARGEAQVKASGAVSGSAQFLLRPPKVRDGVVFSTTVTTEFVPLGSNKATARSERMLTLFPRNPLAGKTEWAKQLDIELFDPNGNTAKTFDELELPYRTVRVAATLHDPDGTGVLMIGEGTSLRENRALAETALKAAASGRRVIMLAPASGALPIPGTSGPDEFNPNELRFAREHIITRFSKKLDAKAWIGANNVIPSSRFGIECRRGRIEVEVSEVATGWPWMEIRFPKNVGVLIVCGFRIIEHWDNGPTPRYLLIRILESLPHQRT